MTYCGLDFGTSNTTIGASLGGRPALLPLEGEETTLPSAIFFDFAETETAIGRAAIAAYVGGAEGRLMRSLKSVLGTELIDQETLLSRRRIAFREVLARLLGEVKRRAEAAVGHELSRVVHGRPVHFVDGDPAADARAEAALGDIARAIGFREISFQFEPIAAALDYERQVTREEIALIADIGGGTSDFSVVRLGPHRRGLADRAADILANDGVRIGGTNFDAELSLGSVMSHFGYRSPMQRKGLSAPNMLFSDLATWSKINFLYTPQVRADLRQLRRDSARPVLIGRLIRLIEERAGHRLAMEVEAAKIRLGETEGTVVDLDWLELGLAAEVPRAEFERVTAPLARGIGALARRAVEDAGLAPEAIDAVFLTGGSTLLPNVRAEIVAAVPESRIVEGDRFGSVGLGLTLEAAARYG
jgi:hypothetical chaperone protein